MVNNEAELSKKNMETIIKIVFQLMECRKVGYNCCVDEAFGCIIEWLYAILHFDYVTFSMFDLDKNGKAVQCYSLPVKTKYKYPEKCMFIYKENVYKEVYNIEGDRSTKQDNFDITLWKDTYTIYDLMLNSNASDSLEFKIKQSFIAGFKSSERSFGTLISLGNTFDYSDLEIRLMLLYICPLLHKAMSNLSIQDTDDFISLTRRELEILSWIEQGKTYWEISQILCISENTVKFHVKNIYEKLDVKNKTQAIAMAYANGILKF